MFFVIRLSGSALSCSTGLLALGLSVTSSVQAETSHPQVLRFAAEGRANLTTLQLACGRSARVTVEALCLVTDGAKPLSWPSASTFSSSPAGPTPRLDVPDLIRIPPARRGTVTFRFETSDSMIRQSVTQATVFLTQFVAQQWLPKSEIRVLQLPLGEKRAYASWAWGHSLIHLKPGILDIGTAVHEIAHHIEAQHPQILAASRHFLQRRARGETAFPLRDLTGEAGYAPDEIAFPANWATRGGIHYSGKFYGPSVERATATELISTGLERLHREPQSFFKSDADYFLFLLLVLQSPAR